MIAPTPRVSTPSPSHDLLARAGAAPIRDTGPSHIEAASPPGPLADLPAPAARLTPSPGHTAIPPWSPRDSALLSAFLNAQAHPLPEVAARAEVSFAEFLDWIDQPYVLARIERIDRASALRSRILAAESRALAIDALRSAAQAHLQIYATHDPGKIARLAETARKAANQLLKLATSPARPGDPTIELGTPPERASHPATAPHLAAEPVSPASGDREIGNQDSDVSPHRDPSAAPAADIPGTGSRTRDKLSMSDAASAHRSTPPGRRAESNRTAQSAPHRRLQPADPAPDAAPNRATSRA